MAAPRQSWLGGLRVPEQKIGYTQLETVYEFPPITYKLDSSVISTYLEAVENVNHLYEDTNLVPPMAIAASALAALSRCMYLPPGAIHVSQKLVTELYT